MSHFNQPEKHQTHPARVNQIKHEIQGSNMAKINESVMVIKINLGHWGHVSLWHIPHFLARLVSGAH